MKKKKRFRLYNWRSTAGYFFIAPSLIGMLFIFLPALFNSLMYSFHDVVVDLGSVSMTPVGWSNYSEALFENTEYRMLVVEGVRGMVVDSILILIFSFLVATTLNQKFIGRSFARTVFFLPVVLSTGFVVSAGLSAGAIDPFSAINEGGNQFGGGMSSLFDMSDFLYKLSINDTMTNAIIYAVNNTFNIVNLSGVQILIFLSALQSIPVTLFEASKVEGATKWEEFWKITFPMITPMIFVNMVYSVIASFTNPNYGILDYIQTATFGSNRLGFGAALSWIYFAIIFLLLGIVMLIFRNRTTYLDN